MKAKKIIGMFVKVILAGVVAAFLGIHSLNFFTYTFPADQFFYAYLGFGLTSGGVFGYLLLFLWDADTSLKKTIAFVMLLVSILGEILAAGFGMQVESWSKSGFEMTEGDLSMMIIVISVLGFLHGLALIGYFAGDKIAELFQDDDGDGIPNVLDPDYRRNGRSPAHQMASETESILDPQEPSRRS